MRPNIYIVHETMEPDSPVIIAGNRKEVCAELLLDEYWIYKLLKNKDNILANQFYTEVRPCKTKKEADQVKREAFTKKKPSKKRPSKYEEYIAMLKNMLDIYGNTGIFKNACKHRSPEKIIERLESDGYHLKVTHEPRRVIKSLLSPGEGEVYEECWIIELLSKEVKE